MSDKRFQKTRIVDKWGGIYDSKTDKILDVNDVEHKLNEQQVIIEQLQDLCGQSDGENAKLRLKNKELQEEIKLLKPTNVEQYEQIVQLQEENEQLKQKLENIGLNEKNDAVKMIDGKVFIRI